MLHYLNMLIGAGILLGIVGMVTLIVLTHEPRPIIPDDPNLPDAPSVKLATCPYCGGIFHGAQHYLHGNAAAGTMRCPECFRVVTYDEALNGLAEQSSEA